MPPANGIMRIKDNTRSYLSSRRNAACASQPSTERALAQAPAPADVGAQAPRARAGALDERRTFGAARSAFDAERAELGEEVRAPTAPSSAPSIEKSASPDALGGRPRLSPRAGPGGVRRALRAITRTLLCGGAHSPQAAIGCAAISP